MLALGDVPAFHAARLGGDRWCVRHGEEVLSWAELDDCATRRAHALAAQGVGQNDIVVIALPNCNALYELTFAIWKLGATPSVVSAGMPASELAEILDLAQPRAFIAAGAAANLRNGALPEGFGRNHPDASPIPSRIARYWKIIASGGSTGRPKLIVAHRPAALDPSIGTLGIPEDSCILNPGPCHHNMPFAMSHIALVRGNAVVGMPRFDALESLRLIEQYRVEWLVFVPTMMRRIWALPKAQRTGFDLSSLRTVWQTAAPMPMWLKRAWIEWLGPERMFEAYGGTEGVGITALDGTEWLAHPGSVGKPLGCTLEIVDGEGRPVPPGEVGDIRFVLPAGQEPFHYIGAKQSHADNAVSLGDQGWMDADGYLFLAGRRTDLILSGGANIYPAEIENVLSACDGVAGTVVIGLPDDDMGERIHAIIEPLDPANPPEEAALQSVVSERLARNKWPKSYEFIPGPLRDSAGKLRRFELRAVRIPQQPA